MQEMRPACILGVFQGLKEKVALAVLRERECSTLLLLLNFATS